MESGHVSGVSVSPAFAAFGLRPRPVCAPLARALSRRSTEMVTRVTTRGRSAGRARPRQRAELVSPVPANAGALRRQALESLVAEAEADLEATHGDDGSSVASTTHQEHADASEVNNVAAFDSLSSIQVNSVASKFKVWAQRAALNRQEQLRQRQADAFARGGLRTAATPALKPSAKKPASSKATRKPAQPVQPAAMHASMEFLAADLQSKLSSLGASIGIARGSPLQASASHSVAQRHTRDTAPMSEF